MHVNVMEALVYQEIQKQLKFYPKNLKSYINLTEVATFALNRLPPLYASSVKGQEEQENIASLKYRKEINILFWAILLLLSQFFKNSSVNIP